MSGRTDVWRTGHGSSGQLELTPVEISTPESEPKPVANDLFSRAEALGTRVDRLDATLDAIEAGMAALRGSQ